MKCERCNSEHDGSYGSGRFCSVQCANSRGKRSDEFKAKVSKKLSKYPGYLDKVCDQCKSNFTIKNSRKNQVRRFCSQSCATSWHQAQPEYKNRIGKHFSNLAKKRYEKGDNSIGWQTRSNLPPSYPEKVSMSILDNNGISYEREVRIGKYFADFVIGESLIIEVDGRQHNEVERRKSDIKKDKYLSNLGYTVVRIKWLKGENFIERFEQLLKAQ